MDNRLQGLHIDKGLITTGNLPIQTVFFPRGGSERKVRMWTHLQEEDGVHLDRSTKTRGDQGKDASNRWDPWEAGPREAGEGS